MLEGMNYRDIVNSICGCEVMPKSSVDDIDSAIEDYKCILTDESSSWINKEIQKLRVEKRKILKGVNN